MSRSSNFATTLRVGVTCGDDQPTRTDPGLDSDFLDDMLGFYVDRLSGSVRTGLCDQRPAFEIPSRYRSARDLLELLGIGWRLIPAFECGPSNPSKGGFRISLMKEDSRVKHHYARKPIARQRQSTRCIRCRACDKAARQPA